MKVKEVKRLPLKNKKVDFYLLVFELLKRGWNPSKIARSCNLSKQVIQYHITKLKAKGLINKVGYGTWEVTNKRSKEVPQVTKQSGGGVCIEEVKDFVPDSVRGHAFQFKLWLPKDLRNWDRREEFLVKQGFDFIRMNFGQRLIFKGRKVWLCNRSVVVYEKSSYWADTSKGSRSYAVADFIVFVKQLERFLGANLSWGGKYKFKVSRQHYSLVKNALAEQYNREGKKLSIFDENGYWAAIDDSFNLKEFETLHPETADTDNKKVQDFFNGVKKLDGYTPQFVTDSIGGLATNFEYHSENMRSHVGAIQELGKGVKELTRIIKKLENNK